MINKLRITHCIKLIGMQLYLLSVIYVKNIEKDIIQHLMN